MASAGVEIKEIDLSTRVPSFPGVYGGIVIPAKKGPIDKPTLVTSDTQLLKFFTPDERIEVGFDLSYFSALAFLERSDKLWVVRAHNQAKYAGASFRASTSSYTNFALAAGLSDPTAYLFDSGNDAAAIAEITAVTAVADSSGSLNNKYFFLNEPTGNPGVYVWLNVAGAGVDPGPFGSRVGVEVAVANNATASVVAAAIASAINTNAPAKYSAVAVGTTVTITNAVAGAVTDASDAGSTGFTINVSTQGANAVSIVDETLLLTSSNPGDWGNKIGVKVFTFTTFPDKVKEPGAFLIEVYKQSNQSTPIESFICSRVAGAKDGFGRNIYVEDVLKASNYIRAINNPAVASSVFPKDQNTLLFLAAGSDGLAVTEGIMVSSVQQLNNVDDIPLTILMDGGFATPAYGQELDLIASSRKDCVAILSAPFSAEASSNFLDDISDYRKTQLNLNTSFSALYSPHVLVFDRFNDRRIYVSPDGYAAAAISFSASNFEIWFPPAGFKRGLVRVLDLRRRFDKAMRDFLYDNGINPIRFTPGKGIAIWGQKTLLSRPSALDRLNVRLLLIVIEPAVAAALEDFEFEFNDAPTRALVVATIESFMNGIKSRRGVIDFSVICDATNNTPDDIDANRLNVDLFVKPNKAAEFITFRVVITSSGLSFDQAASLV